MLAYATWVVAAGLMRMHRRWSYIACGLCKWNEVERNGSRVTVYTVLRV